MFVRELVHGRYSRSALLAASLVIGWLLGSGASARADSINGTLFFTTFAGSEEHRLHEVSYKYDDVTHAFALGTVKDIITSRAIGADGILFAPDGKTLLIGGQSPDIYHVDPKNGKVLQDLKTGGLSVFHLALDPSRDKVYGGGSEAGERGLAVVSTSPFANGTTKPVGGSNSVITGIAFDSHGHAFYTDSGAGGDGTFGTINLGSSPFLTQAKLRNLPAAHGIAFDSYSGDLILVGSNHITQVDPLTTSVIKGGDRGFSGFSAAFDQDAVDGQGQLFVADNDGRLLFVDYHKTGNIASPLNFTTTRFLAASLDDIAPLSGPGAATTPEPSTLTLMSLCVLGLLGYARWARPARTPVG
jgi:hypothetical protein